MMRPDDRDITVELAEAVDAYDRIRATGEDDSDMRARRDELIARLARLDAEVP